MYKRPEVPVADRLIAAIQANREAINICKYGDVTLKVKDGVVYLVEVNGTHTPGHFERNGHYYSVDDVWRLECSCGVFFHGQTLEHAKEQLDEHIANSE